MIKQVVLGLILGLCFLNALAKVYFQEDFNDSWKQRWTQSPWKKADGTAGNWRHTAGLWYGDKEKDKGIQTYPDARFFNLYSEFPEFTSRGKDLVVQFTAKHEQDLDCGGGYLKLMPASSSSQMKEFSGETKYAIMFGPDICGFNRKTHVILGYKGKNYERKTPINAPFDRLTHLFTLVIKPDNTYQVLIDREVRASGSLYDDWDILEPKEIKDPNAKKPEEWEEEEYRPDPNSVKPDDWEDEPEFMVDSNAKKPEDWDDEEDGEWEAPQMKNAKHRGPWEQAKIKNENYKGKWEAPSIANPKFVDDKNLYAYDSLKYIGFELWQVKSGTLIDNILITDDFDVAMKQAGDIATRQAKEQKMYDAFVKKQEEEAKKSETSEKEESKEEDEDEEDDEASLDDTDTPKESKKANDDDEEDEDDEM